MNGGKLFREYAKSLGNEAKEFIEIETGWYSQDTLHTKNDKGQLEKTQIDYKEMVH